MVSDHHTKNALKSKLSTSTGDENKELTTCFIPLKFATDQAFEFIKKNQDANDLLTLLSCFPHGIRRPYIEQLNINKNIDQSIEALQNFAFLQE